jgi:predicted deacylase
MVTQEGCRTYRNIVYRLLVHLDMIDSKDSVADPPCLNPKIIDHRACLANFAGLFRSYVRVGDAVKKGDLLWRVQGLNGESLEEFHAPHGGIVGMLRTLASVQPGDLLSRLFWGIAEEMKCRTKWGIAPNCEALASKNTSMRTASRRNRTFGRRELAPVLLRIHLHT